MRVRGLEPPRLAAQEPKSCASTSSATPAEAHPTAGSRRIYGKTVTQSKAERRIPCPQTGRPEAPDLQPDYLPLWQGDRLLIVTQPLGHPSPLAGEGARRADEGFLSAYWDHPSFHSG